MRFSAVILGSVAAVMAASACGSASTTKTSVPVAVGTVQGSVTAGPTCPVERAGHPCAPRPVQGLVSARRTDGIARTVALSPDGIYRMTLSAGTYILSVQTGSFLPRRPSVTVTVNPGRTDKADISCDTGIR
jgi:hypothetical protein